MGDEVHEEAMRAMAAEDSDAAPAEGDGGFTWHEPAYQDILPTLQAQGKQIHLQSLQLVDKTTTINKTQKSK